MGQFASGLFGLMSNLVQGWTALQGDGGVVMARQFSEKFGGQFGVQSGGQSSPGIIIGGAGPSFASGSRRSPGGFLAKKGAGRTRKEPSPVLPPDNTFFSDKDDSSYDDDTTPGAQFESSDDDDVKKYQRVPRKCSARKGTSVQDSDIFADIEPILSLTGPDDTQVHGNSPDRRSPRAYDKSPSQQPSPGADGMEWSPVAPDMSPSPLPSVDSERRSKFHHGRNANLASKSSHSAMPSAASERRSKFANSSRAANLDDFSDPDLSQGGKIPDVSLLSGHLVKNVYQRDRKRRLRTLRQTELELKTLICKELGLTPGQYQTSAPVRYNHFYRSFLVLAAAV